MKLRELEAFRAVLQTGTVTGAAEQLRLTQPQVSRLIANLEAECGFPLFIRQNQRLIATSEARVFNVESERLLRGHEEVKAAANRIRKQQSDHVRIVTSQPLADGLVSPALRLLTGRNERATFSIEIRAKIEIEARMGQHHFDLGVTSLPLHHVAVTTEPFASREAVLVLPSHHRLASRPVIRFEELAEEPLIVTRRGTYLRDHLEHAFADAGIVPNIRVETALSGFACKLATEGIGIAFVDPFAATAHAGERIVLKPAEPALRLGYAFILPSWQPVSTITRTLMGCIAEVEATLDRVSSGRG